MKMRSYATFYLICRLLCHMNVTHMNVITSHRFHLRMPSYGAITPCHRKMAIVRSKKVRTTHPRFTNSLHRTSPNSIRDSRSPNRFQTIGYSRSPNRFQTVGFKTQYLLHVNSTRDKFILQILIVILILITNSIAIYY